MCLLMLEFVIFCVLNCFFFVVRVHSFSRLKLRIFFCIHIYISILTALLMKISNWYSIITIQQNLNYWNIANRLYFFLTLWNMRKSRYFAVSLYSLDWITLNCIVQITSVDFIQSHYMKMTKQLMFCFSSFICEKREKNMWKWQIISI